MKPISLPSYVTTYSKPLPNILVRNDADNAELMRLRTAAQVARELPLPKASQEDKAD